MVSLRRTKELWGWLSAIGSFLLGSAALHFMVSRNLFGLQLQNEDYWWAFVALGILFLGMASSQFCAYDEAQIPKNLGDYAWRLDRGRLIASGVPARRQGLPLMGEGVDHPTTPDDVQRLQKSASWNRLDNTWLLRIGVTWFAWYGLVYFLLGLYATELWTRPRGLGLHERLYGLWMTGCLLVLYNPLIGLVGNRLLRFAAPLTKRGERVLLFAVPLTLAIPPMGSTIYAFANADTSAAVMMVFGVFFLAAVSLIAWRLWLHNVIRS
jgi:hypothetical protein